MLELTGFLACDVIRPVSPSGAACALVLAAAAVAWPGAAPSAAQAVVGNARTVLAAVVTMQGRPVVDVDVDDFVVTEGTEPREVLDVHVADYPLAIVLDDRPESAGSLPDTCRAARRFIERVGERPIALLTLSGTGEPLVDLEQGRDAALERLLSVTPSTEPPAAPFEVIARAARLLQDSGAPFSAVVVIAGAAVDATAPVRGELLPRILESGAAVHVVQKAEAGTSPEPGSGDLLRVLADQTRGQFTAIFSNPSYEAAVDRLADRLAIEMMVQYLAPAGPRTGDVRVGVRKPGARVVGLGVK